MDYRLVACNTKVYLNDEALIFADGAIYHKISNLNLSNPLEFSYTITNVISYLKWLL
ncbi:hypothetical protein BDR07DRAFT_1436812 [Suillus spraguei]|nr:hypothetical protein BDR07DRAFT_1436812 [Suillus spraguei]